MRKLERRAILCILLALILIAGLAYYVYLWVIHGSEWASYPANQDVYKNGYLSTGTIYDRNEDLLLRHNHDGNTEYNDSYAIRRATVHAVGDESGNISTGAHNIFASQLVGYNLLSGTFTTGGEGRKLYLTIDADLCATASQALGDRHGTVGVYNYETGEIVCMVSKPNFDPLDPPTVDKDDDSGIYLNKFFSSTMVPGSTFKVVTATAAIEQLSDLDEWTYTCTGREEYGDYDKDVVTCPYAHGTVNFEQALAVSCNGAFGKLTEEIGARKMREYTKAAGLTGSYDVDGVATAPGKFTFPRKGVTLAWAGIGQYEDQVNPCSLMVYMGAIAGGGTAAEPRILDSIKYSNGFSASLTTGKTSYAELLDSDTASELDHMLAGNVTNNYGEYNFPGLKLRAKSGTAEISDDTDPHSWFTGYIKNKGYPYAFVVLVEHGGWGSETAGAVANTVLQEIVGNSNFQTDED